MDILRQAALRILVVDPIGPIPVAIHDRAGGAVADVVAELQRPAVHHIQQMIRASVGGQVHVIIGIGAADADHIHVGAAALNRGGERNAGVVLAFVADGHADQARAGFQSNRRRPVGRALAGARLEDRAFGAAVRGAGGPMPRLPTRRATRRRPARPTCLTGDTFRRADKQSRRRPRLRRSARLARRACRHWRRRRRRPRGRRSRHTNLSAQRGAKANRWRRWSNRRWAGRWTAPGAGPAGDFRHCP